MCCCAECALACVGKVVLVSLNVCWVIVGFFICLIGCFLKWGYQSIINLSKTYVPQINQYSSQLGQSISTNQADPFTQYISTNVAIPLIVLGLFFFTVGFLGCCGACCGYGILLIVYAIIVGVIALGQIIALIAIAASQNTIKTNLETQFDIAVKSQYVDIQNTTVLFSSAFSLVINTIMIEGKCCGLSTPEIFKVAGTIWDKSYTESGTTYTLTYPLACCKLNGISNWPEAGSVTPTDINGCVNSPSAANSNKDNPCWNYVKEVVNGQLGWVLFLIIFSILIQIALAAFAIIVYKNK